MINSSDYCRDPGKPATVWVADGRPGATTDYGTRLIEVLTRLGYTVTREDLNHATGDELLWSGLHVLTGGATSVNDHTGWMTNGLKLVTRMIHEAQAGAINLFGVCLGSQMIAECLSPGCVTTGETMRIGITDVEWIGTGASREYPSALPSFHYEQIDQDRLQQASTSLEVEVLARNSDVPVLAFRAGENILATQLHPEFDEGDLDELMAYHQETIARHDGRPQIARGSGPLDPKRTLHMLLSRLPDESPPHAPVI